MDIKKFNENFKTKFNKRVSTRANFKPYNIADRSNINTRITKNASNQTNPSASITSAIISPLLQSNLPISVPTSPASVEERYKFFDKPSDTTPIKMCYDTLTKEEYICKFQNEPIERILLAYSWLHSRCDPDDKQIVRPVKKMIRKDNKLYLLISPSNHGDMHSYIRDNKGLSETNAKNLFRQMSRIIGICHQKGIVLRDVKLRRFVFTNSEKTQIQLESIEEASVLDDPNDDMLNDKYGCFSYMAPEVLQPTRTYAGKPSDMWSLGVCLYSMLAGFYPFGDSDQTRLFAKIRSGQFRMLNKFSYHAKSLLASLLRTNPSERLTAEVLYSHPWFKETPIEKMTRPITNDDHIVPDLFDIPIPVS